MPYTHDGPPLYLADDQTTVVAADNPRAAYLLIAPGGTLPDTVAARFGLPRPAEAEKAATPPPNKLRAGAPSNKAQE